MTRAKARERSGVFRIEPNTLESSEHSLAALLNRACERGRQRRVRIARRTALVIRTTRK